MKAKTSNGQITKIETKLFVGTIGTYEITISTEWETFGTAEEIHAQNNAGDARHEHAVRSVATAFGKVVQEVRDTHTKRRVWVQQ